MYTPRYDDEETVKLTLIGKRLGQKHPEIYGFISSEFEVNTPDRVAIYIEEYFPNTLFKTLESETESELLEWKAKQEAENFNPYANDPEGEYLRREI